MPTTDEPQHILVRDFTEKQKLKIEAEADKAGKSTSRFCRDAAVEKAGAKLEPWQTGNGKKPAKKGKGK